MRFLLLIFVAVTAAYLFTQFSTDNTGALSSLDKVESDEVDQLEAMPQSEVDLINKLLAPEIK